MQKELQDLQDDNLELEVSNKQLEETCKDYSQLETDLKKTLVKNSDLESRIQKTEDEKLKIQNETSAVIGKFCYPDN